MNSKSGNTRMGHNSSGNMAVKIGDPVPKPPKPHPEGQIMSSWDGSPETPLLSVLCITYNHAPYIEDALNSFLMQETNFPFEIIVHDDASTDGNQAIIKKYEEKYPRLIRAVYQKENQYSKGRRALGFFQGMSNARYLAVCEGDDYWLDPKKLQKQVDYLEKHPECVITGHDAFVIDDAGTMLSPSKLPHSQKRDWSAREMAEGKARILTMSWVYRNVVSEFAPERNMVRNGDSFFTSILGQYGGSHYHNDIQPAVYRVHAGGVWSSANEEQKLDDQTNTWFWIYRYYKRIGKHDVAAIFYQKFKANVYRRSSPSELLKALIYQIMRYAYSRLKIKEVLGQGNILRIKALWDKR